MEHQKAAKQFLHLERTRHYILAVEQNISMGTMSILFIGPLYFFQFTNKPSNLAENVRKTVNCLCCHDSTIITSFTSSFPGTNCSWKVVWCEVRCFCCQTPNNDQPFHLCKIFGFPFQMFNGAPIRIHPSVMNMSTQQYLIWELDN